MSIMAFILISIIAIAVLPSATIFILCFIVGLIKTAMDKVLDISKRKPIKVDHVQQFMTPKKARAEAGKIILNKVEMPDDYKLH